MQEITQGTFGRIYSVEDLAADRKNKKNKKNKKVILKVIWSLPTPQLIRELIFSTQIAPLHPGFVPVHRVTHVVPDKLLLYMPQALFSLHDHKALTIVAKELRAQDMMQMAVQLLDAVAFLHDRGLVHMDIKPSNLVAFALQPGTIDVRLCDYGSIHLQQNIDFRWPLGTREWRSPDSDPDLLLEGDPRWKLSFGADIYALGASLAVLLATYLFEQTNLAFFKTSYSDSNSESYSDSDSKSDSKSDSNSKSYNKSNAVDVLRQCVGSNVSFCKNHNNKYVESLLTLLPHLIHPDSKQRISAEKALALLSRPPLNKLDFPLDKLTHFPQDFKLSRKEEQLLHSIMETPGFGYLSHLEPQVESRLKGIVWYWRHLDPDQEQNLVTLAQTVAWFTEEMSPFWDYFLSVAIPVAQDRWICAAQGKPIPLERHFCQVKLADIMAQLIEESGVVADEYGKR